MATVIDKANSKLRNKQDYIFTHLLVPTAYEYVECMMTEDVKKIKKKQKPGQIISNMKLNMGIKCH